MAGRISVRRLLNAIGQEVDVAYIVEYKIFIWAKLSFTALNLLHKVFWDQVVCGGIVLDHLKKAVVLDSCLLIFERDDLGHWFCALLAKCMHY